MRGLRMRRRNEGGVGVLGSMTRWMLTLKGNSRTSVMRTRMRAKKTNCCSQSDANCSASYALGIHPPLHRYRVRVLVLVAYPGPGRPSSLPSVSYRDTMFSSSTPTYLFPRCPSSPPLSKAFAGRSWSPSKSSRSWIPSQPTTRPWEIMMRDGCCRIHKFARAVTFSIFEDTDV